MSSVHTPRLLYSISCTTMNRDVSKGHHLNFTITPRITTISPHMDYPKYRHSSLATQLDTYQERQIVRESHSDCTQFVS